MDKTAFEEWKESLEVSDNVTKSIQQRAKYLQKAAQEFVRRYGQVINYKKPSALPLSVLEKIQEEIKQKSDTRSEEWRKPLFQKNCPVQFENEPHWYKVIQRYRPSRSLYEGLRPHTPERVEMMDTSVQTDFRFVKVCFVLGMETTEKEERTFKASGIWKMCCFGRQ